MCGFIIDKIISYYKMNSQDKIQIEQNSSQWNRITYQLQLATGYPAVRLLNLFRFPVYMDRSSRDDAVEALVDMTDLKSQYKIRVIEKSIPLNDLIFICGHVNLEKYQLQPSKVFKLLLCDVILGRVAPLTEGFIHADSLLIEPENLKDPYHYNMLVKTHSQYTVKYELSFVFGDEIQLQQSPILCVYCGTKTANIYCIDQRKYYCDSCSYNLHPQPEINKKTKYVPQRHQVQKVNRTNSLPLCQSHGSRYQLYCSKCQKYLCDQCFRQPLHNQNPEHPVRPLQYLYTQKRQSNTRLPLKPRQKLQKLLQLTNEKSRVVINNYEEVKRQLILKFEKAMKDLEWQYKQRLVRVQSDLINLQMQMEKIEWDNIFVRNQEEVLKPIHYFKIQARYEDDMREMKIQRYGSSLEVEPDIDQYSLIEVGSREQISQVKQQNKDTTRTIQKNRNQRRTNGHPNDNNDDKAKKQLKLLTFDPDCQPTKRGQLSVFLENSGIRFFKVEPKKR